MDGRVKPGHDDLMGDEKMPLRFCANLGFLFGEVPFLDRIAAAAKAGFKGVEFASPYEYPAAELRPG